MDRRRRRAPRARWIGAAALVLVLIAAVTVVQLSRGGHAATQGQGASGAAAAAASATGGVASATPVVASSSPGAVHTATESATPSSSPGATQKAATSTGSAVAPPPAGYRQITIVNAVQQTIWAATNQNNTYPLAKTGWELAPGQSVTVNVAAQWGGRIWGRTGCSFNSAGVGHCQTGDCGNVFQCKGTGATPATLAELTLGSYAGLDFYDVSMVDGSNLPMYINISHTTTRDQVNSAGCSAGGCTKAVSCPAAMQVKAGGQTVACETACAAFGTDAYCCRGAWSGRNNCNPAKWPVDYAKLAFKDAEPYAYSYAYDDSATMSCRGGCDYRITFGITPGG
jgi:hypothetical protein